MNHKRSGKLPPAPKSQLNKIIFFDIDDTLIGPNINQLINLKKVIINLKKSGFIFGLNTNRPHLETKSIYRKLSLNGPIIAEGGAYYLLKLDGKVRIFPQADSLLNKKIVNFLKKEKSLKRYKVISSNNKKLLSPMEIDNLIFITSTRKYTASLYIRNNGKINNQETKKIFNIIKHKFKYLKVGMILMNGKIIVSPQNINKSKTLSYLLKNHFPNFYAIMISNDENITCNWPNIDFCAIMEAKDDYKKKCSYISKNKGVEGLIEIINNYL